MKKLAAILFFGVFALSTSVQAAYYNFALEGNTLERGYSLPFVTGVDDHIGMPGGLSITASHLELVEVDPDEFELRRVRSNVYFDERSPSEENGGLVTDDGGLGVCKELGTGFQCNPSNDDNHASDGEMIHMVFDETTNHLNLTITGNHKKVAADARLFWETDTQSGDFDIGGSLLTLHALTDHGFTEWTSSLTYWIRGGEMYVTALNTVPVPAAVWLFGTAMLGLFGLRRKTKMEAPAA